MRRTCGCLWRWRNPADLRLGVAGLEHTMGPTIQRIRYTLGEDGDGEPAIHFRIVLDDKVCGGGGAHIHAVTELLETEITTRLDLDNSGLLTYWNYRSQSEQNQLRSGDWE